VCKANDTFESYSGGFTASELIEWFGLTGSVSQRAATMLRAVGAGTEGGYRSTAHDATSLGTTRYLVSGKRRAVVERRDRYRTMGD
jgi:hypothetical protein